MKKILKNSILLLSGDKKFYRVVFGFDNKHKYVSEWVASFNLASALKENPFNEIEESINVTSLGGLSIELKKVELMRLNNLKKTLDDKQNDLLNNIRYQIEAIENDIEIMKKYPNSIVKSNILSWKAITPKKGRKMKNILMNIAMTKAILDSKKIQTRRILISEKHFDLLNNFFSKNRDNDSFSLQRFINTTAKYKKNEVIGVREPVEITNFIDTDSYAELSFKYIADDVLGSISSDNKEEYELMDFFEEKLYGKEWVKAGARVPYGCFSEMIRIFLKITDIKIEKLQDISYESIMDEGCDIDIMNCISQDGTSQEECINHNVRCWYKKVWNKTAPKGYKWEDNPDVFVYTFEVVNFDKTN